MRSRRRLIFDADGPAAPDPGKSGGNIIGINYITGVLAGRKRA